jgi:heptosyltransferase-2
MPLPEHPVSSREQQKILVLRYRFIGDTILTVPFLRNLRRAKPDAWITWVVAPGSAEVVKGIPYVDELLYWDPVTIHADSRGAHRTLTSRLSFVRELRRRNFDTAYVLKRSFSSALMAFFSGARKRIGFNTEGRGFLLTKRVPYCSTQHEVRSFLDVLAADGIPILDDYLESWSTPAELQDAHDLLCTAGWSEGQRLLAVHPFGAIHQKTWSMERFAQVAEIVSERFGFVPIVLGAPQDKGLFAEQRHLFPATTIDLVGRCNLRTTMAVLNKFTSFFLGNDSGVMHLAAAAGVPLVALYGPTSPTRFGPWGARAEVVYSSFPCSPCRQKYFTECEPTLSGKPACVDSITVESVVETCARLLCNEEHLKTETL